LWRVPFSGWHGAGCDLLLLLLPPLLLPLLVLQLLDELLKEEHVMDVIGCLEYDPELTAAQQHRQFLSSAVVFKEVVPITSQDVLAKIHQTYRIQYLKDVILPRRCGRLATAVWFGCLATVGERAVMHAGVGR
jgi:hypothetical protein